jgi:23S rRNA pseudouridine1911/1915/1917 synthase
MNEMMVQKIVVDGNDSGERLDTYLASQLTGVTRSQAKRLIEMEHVTVDAYVAKPSHQVKAGEKITVKIPPPVEPSAAPQDIPLDVIFEDSDIIVVNKPVGMVVHPAAGHPDGTLVNALLGHCKDLSGIGGELKAGIVHRLDVGTSGAIIAAKNDNAHVELQKQFKARTVEKVYGALVMGSMREESGEFDSALGRHRTKRQRISSHTRKGRAALTGWRVLERFGTQLTWVEVDLKTGRTHQIRVHFAEAGHALVGDPLYGGERKLKRITDLRVRDVLEGFERPALHAWRLGVDHPRTGERMKFEAPLPSDMKNLLDKLRGLFTS